MLDVYGSILVALGCWATFTTWSTLASRDGQRPRRTLGLLGAAFVASCLLPGVSMLVGAFEPWMLIPLAACFVILIPYPCYFRWANHGWTRVGRGVLFLLVGVGLVAAALGLLPLSWFGL